MKRLANLSLALALVSLSGCGSRTASGDPAADNPNVVIIYTDDMNFQDIGALGGKVLTPHIDMLMNQGIYFSNYLACSAVCSPSRYNLLTGRYASRSQSLLHQYPVSDPAFLRWNTDIDPGERTMAHVMKENGYYTGMVGKYHNFQNEPVQDSVSVDAHAEDPGIQERIRANYNKLKDQVQEASGFDYLEHVYINNLHALGLPKTMQHHNMDWITQGGLDFLDRTGDRPFFLYFATTLPHEPAPLSSMYADPRITPSGLLEEVPGVQPERMDVIRRVKEAGFPENTAPYTWLDDAIGVLVHKLDQMGVLENTIILFASDHGGNKAKMTCYQEGIRAPAFAYWKDRFEAEKKLDQMVANIDFAPTVYELCGITPRASEVIDGQSLAPLLRGTETDWRTSLFLEIAYSRAVVTERWKYIAVRFPEHIQSEITPENNHEFNQEGTRFSVDRPGRKIKVRYQADRLYPGYFDRDQLYDLHADPQEQHNLAGDAGHQETLEEMKVLLGSYLQDFPHGFGEFTPKKNKE